MALVETAPEINTASGCEACSVAREKGPAAQASAAEARANTDGRAAKLR